MAGDDWTMDGASYVGGWSRAPPDTVWETVPSYDQWMERLNGVRDALEGERADLIDKRSALLRDFAEQLEHSTDSQSPEAEELAAINERALTP